MNVLQSARSQLPSCSSLMGCSPDLGNKLLVGLAVAGELILHADEFDGKTELLRLHARRLVLCTLHAVLQLHETSRGSRRSGGLNTDRRSTPPQERQGERRDQHAP